MIVVDKFQTWSQVLAHLDMAKRCYRIIKQDYESVIGVEEIEDDIVYIVVLKLYNGGNRLQKNKPE